MICFGVAICSFRYLNTLNSNPCLAKKRNLTGLGAYKEITLIINKLQSIKTFNAELQLL
jgi:hypothetical protein